MYSSNWAVLKVVLRTVELLTQKNLGVDKENNIGL
jgi:hypothetical protein